MAASSSSQAGAALAPEIWQLPEMVAYFRAESEIAEALSENDFSQIINVDSDWIKLVRTALEYQGFDPRVILVQLIRNRKAYIARKPNVQRWDLSNVGDDFKITPTSVAANIFSNDEPLSRDVNFLITVFLSRNNHINKIVMKARGGVEDILNMLKDKYNIDDESHRSGTALESRTITLPRIAGVFPATAVRMFDDQVVKEIVTYESFPGTTKPATHAICCPILPSVCPIEMASEEGGNFHPVMLWTAIKLDDIIHRKEQFVTPLSELLGYYRAGFQSAAMPEKSRCAIFKHLKLADNANIAIKPDAMKLTVEARALANSCLSCLGQMRVGDENHDLLMRVAKTGNMNLF